MLKKATWFASLRFSAVIEIAVCSNVDKSISVLDTIVTKKNYKKVIKMLQKYKCLKKDSGCFSVVLCLN